MANTTVNSALQVTKFLTEFFEEYIRENRFSKYTGTDNNAVITIKEGREIINMPLVTRLKGDGVNGSQTLFNNEEQINSYAMTLIPTYYRNAVTMTKEEKEKPAFDLMKASRALLMGWAKEVVRDQIIQAMGQAIIDDNAVVNYGVATGAQLDIWNTNNADRILYGSLKSNLIAGNHTSSLATIDSANDKMTAGIVSLAKEFAEQADPHITPLRTMKDDEEWFVMFCDPCAFRDLKNDPTINQANRDAWTRGSDNPIFTDGDLIYDGVIIRKIPELAKFIDGTTGTNGIWGGAAAADGLNGAGATASRVGVSFLCGQQAVAFGLGQRPNIEVDLFDYKFKPGVAIELKQNIRKANFNKKQHGMVTIFTSSAKSV